MAFGERMIEKITRFSGIGGLFKSYETCFLPCELTKNEYKFRPDQAFPAFVSKAVFRRKRGGQSAKIRCLFFDRNS
ncbi:hypothetical protein ACWAU0_20945 [Methylomonas sp. YC3]